MNDIKHSTPSISVEEQAALRHLVRRGPTRRLSARVSGRLSLYGMLNEGPRGWFITELGRRTLEAGRVMPLSPDQALRSVGPVLATAENMSWTDDEK